VGSCHLCGRRLSDVWATATDVEYGTTSERFDYLHCLPCDALSIDPLPADRLAEIYPLTYYSFASGADVLDADRNLVTRVKARLDRGAFARALGLAGSPRAPHVLDVGGGSGDISAGLVASSPGAQATVVDLDPRSVEVARSRGLGGWVGRFEDFETDQRYDLVLMLNLIEHVADPAAVLRKAAELLGPSGIAWIQTPNFHSLDARLFRHRNWTGLHCPRHWVVLGQRGLRQALTESGLAPISLERSQAGSFWATSLMALPHRHGRSSETDLPKPLVAQPAFMPLAAAGAAFDILTRRARQTSQVVAYARRGTIQALSARG